MKKRTLLLLILSIFLIATAGAKEKKSKKTSKKTILVYSYTDEVPNMVNEFSENHPDFKYNVENIIVPSPFGEYAKELQSALENNDSFSPDIFVIDLQYLYEFTKGNMSEYVMPVNDLGIDIDAAIEKAEISSFTVDLGRNANGDVAGLSYDSSSGVFIYRRSIAKKVFGTDDPAVIQKRIGGGENDWKKFFMAASVLAKSGYSIVSGIQDLWLPFENSAEKGWIVDGKVYVDPKREAFLDYAKTAYDKGFVAKTQMWTDEWFESMKGEIPVFGFFGPAWFLNYVLAYNSIPYGSDGPENDWAICESPEGFYWGGSWIFVNKNLKSDKKAAVKQLIEYLTLDCSKDGAMYKYADSEYAKQTVVSGEVMKNIDGRLDFLFGQNMYDIFIKANQSAKGTNFSNHDDEIENIWLDEVNQYVTGQKSRARALADFKRTVTETFALY